MIKGTHRKIAAAMAALGMGIGGAVQGRVYLRISRIQPGQNA